MIPRSARALGFPVLLLGLWGGLVPFAGPSFGFPMPAGGRVPAWQWSASHAELHAAPAIAAIIAGAGLLLARRRAGALMAGSLGVLAGAWFVLAPTLASAWQGGEGMGHGPTMMVSTFMTVVTPLAYHYATGVLVAICAALALGILAVGAGSRADGRAADGRVAPAGYVARVTTDERPQRLNPA